MLAWGKSSLNLKSGVNPTGPDHSKNRETVFSDHCHQTGPVSGGQRDRNFCQTACRVQTNPISGLRKPWGGWSLGSINVEGGLHSLSSQDQAWQGHPIYQMLCTSSQEPILVRSITSAYGQGMVQSSQFKSLGFFTLAWFQNHTTIGDLF